MKSGVRITWHEVSGHWMATECEPQGKDTYVRVLGWYSTKESALEDFPNAEVEDGRDAVPVAS